MTKRAVHRVRLLDSVVVLCLVLLQLLNALHFVLVPHRLGSGRSGLVHLRGAPTSKPSLVLASRATQPAPDRPTAVAHHASCEPEACPLGFAGQLSRPVVASELSQLICFPEQNAHWDGERFVESRTRALLSAPKTSPPTRA